MGEYGYGYPPPTSAPSIYGGQRPTFSADGTGMPYNSLLNMVGSSVLNQDISYDTSSKDPEMVRARIFIGNLGWIEVTRDEVIDLCKPFGRLLAVTLFKGYAFVQFSEAHEANKAFTSLNGKRWKGTIIDVNIASTAPGGHKKKVEVEASRKRRYDDYSRDEPSVLDETADQNRRNRDVAGSDNTNNEDLAHSAMADTLICGGCRFVTCDFEVFKDHRIAGCQNVKVEGEPKQMRCASCNQRFGSAWALMCHLTDFHRMQLYREDEQPPITPSESADPVPAKKSSSYIMPMDSTKSLPLPEGETASANVTPIGQGAVEPKTSEVVAPHMPPPAVPQWNPMTGHTIVGLQGLQPPPQNDGPQPIPSLGGGISTIYGVH